ncbi:hypothetical protein SUDANB1_04178 [Streptomyces sp. enrichment culture]|uniref:hypothetical protein n=1 Tax=Streptomyces sp. enrichment culture TaxID=1795815 RepID=UPI003F570579
MGAVAVWMTRDFEGVGRAAQAVERVDEAAGWLIGSAKRSRRAFAAEWQWLRVMDSVLRVRGAMLDEGRRAVESGTPWTSETEGVRVRLSPRGHQD